jgi:EAL domain-containing protein (putative c-di-GMP-specific phosphodiesterase class I)/GGDEF domain-containing protein
MEARVSRPSFRPFGLRFEAFGFRARIVALAALAASAPWIASLASMAETLPVGARWLIALAAAVATFAALHMIAARLRPLGAAALALRQAGENPRAGEAPRDELKTILAAIDDMRERLSALQHRSVQQHPLTELPTREHLLAEMQRDMVEGAPEAMLGVIRFRDYDRLAAFDSAKADLALRLFAQLLAAAVGSKRPLAQVDRDSFGIWYRGVSLEDARTELRSLCYALGSELTVGDLAIRPEVDASAASFPSDADEAAALITRSLISLDSHGRRSADSIALRMPKPIHAARERFSLEQDLRHAIEREQLELHFQPIVDLEQGRLVGAEALIRWHHPTAGCIAPARFIPILEDAHLTDEIGMWALNAACKAASGWQGHGLDSLRVAVNLSATQLKNPNLVRMISRTLERHKLAPRALELELTETAATEDAERTFRLFGELRAMGVSLAIDDFGSGYSSLSYLKNLPFDKLKIDREFVVEVQDRPDSQAICRTLVELARGLRIRLVAEGVETAAEVGLLQNLGCSLFQGYFFSTPLSDAEFIEKASDRAWERSLAHPFDPHHLLNDRLIA